MGRILTAALIGFCLVPLARASGDTVTQLLRLPIPDKVEFCGEAVPLDREDTLERLDLELVATLGNSVTTTLWLKRIPRYFPLIEQQIRAKKLPDDLKYITLIESALRASAVSRASAVGPWQFIPSTGIMCGLEQTEWRDERRDWEEATRAALDHLRDLRSSLGSWPLALAAYNAGQGRIAQALSSQGQRDFYGLRLPRETERYVFQIIASKLVVENPGAYGIDLEGARRYPILETAEVPIEVRRRSMPLAAIAQAAGVSYRWLEELNPWIVARELPRGTHRITVPATSKGGLEAALAGWENRNPEPAPEPKASYYQVRSGDTLTSIAQRHNLDLQELCVWNNLTSKSVIRTGQKLLVAARSR